MAARRSLLPIDHSSAGSEHEIALAMSQSSERVPRSFSTGFSRSIIYNYWHLYAAMRTNNLRYARDNYRRFERTREVFEARLERPMAGLDVLEVGSGQRFATTLLFAAAGAHAVGIDMDYVSVGRNPRDFIATWRRNGFQRAAKSSVRKLLFDPDHYRELEKLNGRKLPFEEIDLRVMDACHLNFPDSTFDCVFSNNVFEHIYDVETATTEMHRTLRPGGVAVIGICLYWGISGGHHPEWGDPDEPGERRVPPWDHIRSNAFPQDAFLNKWRRAEYLETFARRFDILDVNAHQQGASHLTEQILAEVPGATADELLTDSIVVTMRRPATTP